MSSVKCHYCGAEIPLESARPRGGMCSGFMCSKCFVSKSVTAFLVVGGLSVLFIMGASSLDNLKKSRNQQSRVPAINLAALSNASYTSGGITTRVQETIPYLLQEWKSESNWQELLWEPIRPGELSAAGFGYTEELMDARNVGSLSGPQTPGTVTIMVKATKQNYYFRVTQSKAAP